MHAGAKVPACDPAACEYDREVTTIPNNQAKPDPDGTNAAALARGISDSALDRGHDGVPEGRMTRFGALEIPEAEAARLSDEAIANRLVESGVSRLSAARIVAVVRGKDEPGRARPHPRGR